MYSLYYCVYSTIEIALSARSSKYNTYSKYILSLHITPNVSFYYKYLYCNCPELLKNRFEIYSCHSIISSCKLHISQNFWSTSVNPDRFLCTQAFILHYHVTISFPDQSKKLRESLSEDLVIIRL